MFAWDSLLSGKDQVDVEIFVQNAMAMKRQLSTATPRQQRTISGAPITTAAGAGIAAISGDTGWTGAAIGAFVGGVAGNSKCSRQ